MTSRRIVFMGTPAFAVPTLQALLDTPHQLVGVFTQPDRPVGRGQQVAASPVKELAIAHHLSVFQPERLRGNEEALANLASLAPDLIVVVAYGQILPTAILELPPFRCINVHASLLPAYRGAAPIQWAVVHGEAETGVTTMLMEQGLDTGPMLLTRRTPIGPDETADQLATRLAHLGAELLVQTLEPWFQGTLVPTPQDDALASKAPMLRKEMATVDWSMAARALHDRVRGMQPWPGAVTTLEGESLKILRTHPLGTPSDAAPGTLVHLGPEGWDIATGDGLLRLLMVQRPGRKAQEADVARRGWPAVREGARLS